MSSRISPAPSTIVSGVRISWLIVARNIDFAREASSAASRAASSSRTARSSERTSRAIRSEGEHGQDGGADHEGEQVGAARRAGRPPARARAAPAAGRWRSRAGTPAWPWPAGSPGRLRRDRRGGATRCARSGPARPSSATSIRARRVLPAGLELGDVGGQPEAGPERRTTGRGTARAARLVSTRTTRASSTASATGYAAHTTRTWSGQRLVGHDRVDRGAPEHEDTDRDDRDGVEREVEVVPARAAAAQDDAAARRRAPRRSANHGGVGDGHVGVAALGVEDLPQRVADGGQGDARSDQPADQALPGRRARRLPPRPPRPRRRRRPGRPRSSRTVVVGDGVDEHRDRHGRGDGEVDRPPHCHAGDFTFDRRRRQAIWSGRRTEQRGDHVARSLRVKGLDMKSVAPASNARSRVAESAWAVRIRMGRSRSSGSCRSRRAQLAAVHAAACSSRARRGRTGGRHQVERRQRGCRPPPRRARTCAARAR